VAGAPAAAEQLWDTALADALDGRRVASVYQPIVDVSRRVVAGYEALTRFDAGPDGPRGGPDAWFAAAARRGLVAELDAVAVRSALSRRADLPPNCFLSVNLEPESIGHPVVDAVLDREGRLDGLVIEVTEHREIADEAGFAAVLDRFRAAGALIAVDDAGAGHAGLTQILLMRPGVLKLDRALVENIDHDEAKSALVEMLGLFANRVDAWLLAEGVETIGEARRIEELGVPLAQGYLYARPGAPWAEIAPAALAELRQADPPAASAGLHRLVAPATTITLDEVPTASRHLAERADQALVVVDEHRRPLGLLTPDSALARTLVESLRVNLHTSPAELAHRLATRSGADLSAPVLVTDDRGHLVGVVTLARLLRHLAGGEQG